MKSLVDLNRAEGIMRQANVNATALSYSETGTGAPLVFVHGSASDHRTWHLQQDALAERFRVISYSRCYHWPNETIPGGGDYSMEELDDLQGLIRTLVLAEPPVITLFVSNDPKPLELIKLLATRPLTAVCTINPAQETTP